MLSLTEKLAKLRETTNTSPESAVKTPTDLETFLRIYNKSGRECYIDYMAGAKALYKFLSPITIPSDVIFNSTLTNIAVLHSYEVSQLASVIVPAPVYSKEEIEIGSRMSYEERNKKFSTTRDWHSKHSYVSNLIVYYTAKHILEEVIK